MTDRIQEIESAANILRPILWQYESAEKLVNLALRKQESFNKLHTAFWRDWYRDVFNIDTANDFGIEVWARILGVQLGYTIAPQLDKIGFGFGLNRKNFSAPSNFGVRSEGFQNLSTSQKRMLLKMRYVQLTHRPSVPIINEALNRIFNDGRGTTVYVYDNYQMEFAAYVFSQEPAREVKELLEQFDLLPRPSTLKMAWVVERRKSFGFGQHRYNFNNGNFGA